MWAYYERVLSRTGFLTQLKSKKVEISKEKTSQMIVKGKLSEAVMKGMGSDKCIFKGEDNTKRNLARVTTKSKSEMQTVSNGCVGRWARIKVFEECPNVRDLIK